MSLSVVIICKNSESTIGRTLASVAGLATEIVALDSGSTDTTIAQLEREGARVERIEWLGHIATKQLALEAAGCDWILSIDSDESLEPDLAEAIRRFVERDDPTLAAARVNRKTWYAGRPLNFTWQPELRLRLVRRADVLAGLAAWGGINPHDKLVVSYKGDRQPSDPARAGRPAKIVDLPGTLRHDSFTNMRAHLSKPRRDKRNEPCRARRDGELLEPSIKPARCVLQTDGLQERLARRLARLGGGLEHGRQHDDETHPAARADEAGEGAGRWKG